MNLSFNTPFITEEECLYLEELILKKSQGEDIFIQINDNNNTLSRFSENQICQNIDKKRFNLTITSYFGKKSASASTNQKDIDSVLHTLKQSEELAHFAPEDPEWVNMLPPQNYDERIPAFIEKTATISPLETGNIIKEVCQNVKKIKGEASGILSTNSNIKAIANSQGLRGYNKTTEANFSLTVKIKDGSSWESHIAYNIDQLPIKEITENVLKKALFSCNPREIKPGIYPVIFSPCAFGNLLPWLIGNLDARAADEGRSFMTLRDKNNQIIGNKVGELLFNPLINIARNPAHNLLQTETFFNNGLPNNYLDIIKNGIPQTLSYSRYWAKEKNKKANGYFTSLVMAGDNNTIEDLISSTEKGIFVNRTWYINIVNPRTLEITGMTRDGTFWIEDGKLAYPIKNFRFNHSLPNLLRDGEALSQVQRFGNNIVPGIKVKAFNFSSISDSI
jgi:predicted Zn-dependent protease